MRATAERRVLARAALACGLAAAVLLRPASAPATILGSPHDFSAGPHPNALPRGGSCSSCHIPHKGKSTLMWTRNLDREATVFSQTRTPPASTPADYIPYQTLKCYDCHDDMLSVDNVLPRSDWPDPDVWQGGSGGGNTPQNIAFTDLPGPPLSTGTATGYYELYNGAMPGAAPTDGSPTGGHYWKTNAGPSPDVIERGDKIDCALCHDLHRLGSQSNTNEALISDAWGTNLKASTYNVTTSPYGSRNGTGTGREICQACHANSDQGTPLTILGVNLPRPTATINQHQFQASGGTPCVACHRHNKIVANCEECHGFPPLNATVRNATTNPNGYTSGYPNGAAVALTHRRHLDALGATVFSCEICHGPNAGSATWHDEAKNGTVTQAKINIMGQSAYWDAENSRSAGVAGYSGTTSGAPATPASYEFSAKGAAPMVCYNFTCHGDPPAPPATPVLAWIDDMVEDDPISGNYRNGIKLAICKWCHDTTPARINGVVSAGYDPTRYAPMVAGNASFGADVNGHGRSSALQYDKDAVGDAAGAFGANRDCHVCHDATYPMPPPPNDPTEQNPRPPTRTHFFTGVVTDPRDAKRLRATINGVGITNSAVFPTGPDQACSACHQNGNAADGADWAYHGIPPQPPPPGGYKPSEGADQPFTRACRQCHEVHGSNWNGTGRNLYMIGRWIDDGDRVPNAADGARVDSNAVDELADITTADNAVVFTATTGANSFDEVDTVGTQDADDICATCHTAATRGGDHSGTPSFGGDMRGQNCLQCHDHDYDNDYATRDAFMPSGCEGCHNSSPHVGCDGLPGTADDAPNVMGDGVNPAGAAAAPNNKPYDDGTFGYNVNGHGANGFAPNRPTPALNPDLQCIDCHDLASPQPSTHFDCVGNVNLELNTYNWPGKPSDTRNANTAHLLSGYLAGAANPQAKQLAFDDYCYNQCHLGAGVMDMRHSTKVNGVPDRIMQFSQANDTTDDPKQDRGPEPVTVPPDPYKTWYPWTIDDLDVGVDANPPAVRYHGTCASCHDPHGTDTVQKTRLTNKMVIHNWKGTSMQQFCNYNCHKIP